MKNLLSALQPPPPTPPHPNHLLAYRAEGKGLPGPGSRCTGNLNIQLGESQSKVKPQLSLSPSTAPGENQPQVGEGRGAPKSQPSPRDPAPPAAQDSPTRVGWTEPRLLPPRWVSGNPCQDHPPWGLPWCPESISLSGGRQMALAKFPPKCYFPDSFPFPSEGAAGWEEASLGSQGPNPPTSSQEPSL